MTAMEQLPSVAETFEGKTLLMTGASGFVGKAVLEKLLRCCPGIRRIYVILRCRRGTSPALRLQSMLQEPVFGALCPSGDWRDKVVAVEGDCASKELGLSAADRHTLQDEVDVFIHSAASVRFDDPLQTAVLLNTRGAQEAATLALGMKHLKVLVHVSTAYCNTHQPVIGEQVYPMPPEVPAGWRQLVKMAEDLSVTQMERVPMGYHPNTYTFSKALAEQVIKDHSDRLNVVIFRPSNVVGAFKEPIPGWTNNLNGPLSLCVGITKGLVHTTLADKDAVIDFVPLESAVNGIIVAAYRAMLSPSPSGQVSVYTCSAGNRKPMSVCQSIACALDSNAKTPHDRVLWNPFVVVTSNMAFFTLLSCLFHFLPALLVDAALKLTGNRTWLLRTYWKIYRAMVSLRYFTLNHWIFENECFYSLQKTLNEKDAATFVMDLSDEDEYEFLDTHLQFIRQHILKESMNLKAARRNQTIMYVLDRCVRALLFYACVKLCLFAISRLWQFIGSS